MAILLTLMDKVAALVESWMERAGRTVLPVAFCETHGAPLTNPLQAVNAA